MTVIKNKKGRLTEEEWVLYNSLNYQVFNIKELSDKLSMNETKIRTIIKKLKDKNLITEIK